MPQTPLAQALEAAIASEIDAHRFYTELASRAASARAAQTFAALAEEELGHRDMLMAARRYPDVLSRTTGPAEALPIAESSQLPTRVEDMKPAEAIAFAMKSERHTAELYTALATSTTDPALADLLNGLARMERTHEARLEAMLVHLADADSF
jgi:rubrerythrin